MKSSRRSILVVTTLEQSSVVALRRGYRLSQIFSARLHVVHPLVGGRPPLVVTEKDVKQRVRRWAAAKAKILVADDDIHVGLGPPSGVIARTANHVNAELVVIGSSPGIDDADSPPDIPLEPLVRSLPQALLVARPRRTASEIVAATDLENPRCPVVRTAAGLARALSARLTVVHNLDGQEPVCVGAVEKLNERLRMLEELADEVEEVERGRVSTKRTTAAAIADIVRTHDADIAVVGVRRGHATTVLALLGDAGCSVLCVPLGSTA